MTDVRAEEEKRTEGVTLTTVRLERTDSDVAFKCVTLVVPLKTAKFLREHLTSQLSLGGSDLKSGVASGGSKVAIEGADETADREKVKIRFPHVVVRGDRWVGTGA